MELRRNRFNQIVTLKKAVISSIGVLTYPILNLLNSTSIEGGDHLKSLPESNILIVSNHHTYFMDVIAMYHVILSARVGFTNSIRNPVYLLYPWEKFHFVAAAETMHAGLIPRILAYAGSISVKRTWKEGDHAVNRKVNPEHVKKIRKGLRNGWVVTFPQGTTKPNAPGRIGTAHLIKEFRPIVVPLVIDGFKTAFDRTGLRMRKLGVTLSLRFKAPLDLDYDAAPPAILNQVMRAIEEAGPGG